jgi:2,3-bisphosphoglycerate-dependent phosphoglycerate mutase
MLGEIPLTESLKDTVARSSVYWDEVLAPALRDGKTLLVVGHENNLRSLLMRLEDIDKDDILHLNLPRAVPLAYRLDLDTLKPLDRADGTRDEATGYLRGEWIGGDSAVKEILDRDYKQVYDTSVTQNLEIGDKRDKWNAWMEFLVGKPSPYQKAVGCDSEAGPSDFLNVAPVPAVERDPLEDCTRKRSAGAGAPVPHPLHIEERSQARAA